MTAGRELRIALLVHQLLIFLAYAAVALPHTGPLPVALSFYLVSPVVPLACWIWVSRLPSVLQWDDGTPMRSLGIANHLTLLRLASMPALSYLLYLSREFPEVFPALAVWAGLAFLTDLTDGLLSRGLHQISRFGRALDSSSDYMLLISLLIVLTGLDLLPRWLPILGLVRLGAQMAGMLLLMWRKNGLILETTSLGKAAVFALMLNLFAHLARYLGGWPATEPLHWLDWATAVVLVVSLVDKALYFVRTWKRVQQPSA